MPGAYLDVTTCKDYEVGQHVEYLSGGRWKPGVVEFVSDGMDRIVKVKGLKNDKAKVYKEIKPKPLPQFIQYGGFKL